MFKIIAIMATTLLTGCMTTAYQAPAGEAVANIKFANQGRGKGEIFIYQQAELCTGKQDAGSVERMDNKKVPVLANGPLSFSFGYGFSDYVSSKSCSITGTFEPKPAQEYEILIVSTYQGCAAYLYHVVDGQKQNIPAEQKAYSKPLTNDNWCEPMVSE